MSGIIYFDSDEYMRGQREKRVHILPCVKGACAVHVLFAEHSIVVELDTLSSSIHAAKELTHKLMRDYDHNPNRTGPVLSATIRPITAEQVRALDNGAALIDSVHEKAVFDLCVSTCYAVIRDCPDPAVRLDAAKLLHAMGNSPRSV